DPVDYPANGGDNDDNESSDDDDDDDDVEKDGEDDEEEEHLAPIDPVVVPIDDPTERQKEKVAENASNKRKWEGNHNGSSSQQNKGHKVPRAHTAWPINKKAYAGSLPLCNQCKFHHNEPCTIKCRNCKKALEQVKRLHAMNVGIKGTTEEIVWSERTKTMKTKSKVLKRIEWCMPLEEEKLNKTLTTLRIRLKLKRESFLA
nr:reverse transcriptase domain-containing protein [Tanacetum cinerariifolium]